MTTAATIPQVAVELPPKPRTRVKHLSPRLRASAAVSYLILIALALIYIYPFLISIAGGFKTDADATQNPLSLIPQTWSFKSFETLFTVLTLGTIGAWQVFDQIYLTGKGAPGKTLLTPAFLAYDTSFSELNWGEGAAIAFVLFLIIVALTLLQRWVLRDRDVGRRAEKRAVKLEHQLRADAAAALSEKETAR